MKISNRDLKLIFVLFGVLIFLALYMLVYQPAVEDTEAANVRISKLRPEVEELEMHYERLQTYESSIAINRVEVDKAMRALPGDVQEEDTLSYLLGMEKNKAYFMQTVTFQPTALQSQFDAHMHIDGQDVVAPVKAYRHSTTLTGEMTYQQAKQVMDYLYATQDQTVLDSVGLTYNAGSGQLAASFQISQFSLDWPSAVYVPAAVPNASLGVSELFGMMTEEDAD